MTRRWQSARGLSARASAEAGVTLVEATIVVTVVATLAAALTPSVTATLDRARYVRAVSDMEAIKSAIINFLEDGEGSQGYDGFTIDGDQNGEPVDILVSDGDIPRTIGAGGSATWDDPVDNTTGAVDFLERHLVTNNPRGSALNAYDTVAGSNSGYWKGAYLNGPVDPDPWGNRYAVNTERLWESEGLRDVDVLVLCVGPDEEIDSAYNTNFSVPGDDDIIVIIRRDPGRTVP